jgi:hypothetical protein
MTFTWFKIFNLTEFEALGLVSRTYTQVLEGIGQKDVLVTKGECVSILYEGIFLPLQLNDINPFIKNADDETEVAHAIYIDANDDVYLGIEEPDEN